MAHDETFLRRYGPWALVVGASDGVGAEWARAMAGRGLHVVLVARRAALLDRLAAEIERQHGVRTRTVAVDLTEPDAVDRVLDAVADLSVGMLFYNAGADPIYQRFLVGPEDPALDLITRNCVVPTRLCHRLAAPMAERGGGALVLVSSGAGLSGGANMVAYGATKAFGIVLAEGLWAELHDVGVDVLAPVLGPTDTPSLRRLLHERGALPDLDGPLPLPGVATSADVVAEIVEHLRCGPVHAVGEQVRDALERLRRTDRNTAVAEAARMQQASGFA